MYEDMVFDSEDKITEFNYENYIPEYMVKSVDNRGGAFKDVVKASNLFTKTNFEQHCADQTEFRKLMPILATLDDEESEIFFHMIRNKGRDINNATRRS